MREGKKRKLFEAVIEPCYENVYRFILSQTKDQELTQDSDAEHIRKSLAQVRTAAGYRGGAELASVHSKQ